MHIYYLLGGLLAVYLVSSVMNGALHDSTAELEGDVRDRLFRGEARMAWLWRTVESIGFVLVLAAIFAPQLTLFTKTSQRVLSIAGGLLLFCISNTASAWFANAVYRREAPGTRSSRAALRAAIVVTLAELALLGVVLWFVSSQLGWFSPAKSGAQPAEVGTPNDGDDWIDEADALMQLKNLPPDYAKDPEYVKGLAESGTLHTKTIDGKKKYSKENVETLKKRKNEKIPD